MEKSRIHFLLDSDLKKKWQGIAKLNHMTLTEYIVHKVEGNLGKNERKQILQFIEISTNVDSKVENNINQIAKWVNMDEYLDQLNKYQRFMRERNSIFRKIIFLLSKI